MEGDFSGNVSRELIIHTSSSTAIPKINTPLTKNENKLKRTPTGYNVGQIFEASKDGKLKQNSGTKVINLIKCRLKNLIRLHKILFGGVTILHLTNISMLERFHSMEFESDDFISSVAQPSDSLAVAGPANSKETDENPRYNKKTCNSSNADEDKVPKESNFSGEINPSSCRGRADVYRRFSQSGDNVHVTQSRSIFSHEDSFVYGNPKEDIKNIEKPCGAEAVGETPPFENSSLSVLDLSCKSTRPEEKSQLPTDGDTYQNYIRSNFAAEPSFPRSNLDIKVVQNPASKKPSIPEQLQIAKIQQQQRRSMQQQQKFLQQMRRSLDPKPSNRQESPQTTHKNVKYYGNTTTNQEQNDLDNHPRVKDFPPAGPGPHFPQFPYPYFDPRHPKELPDNHPILPLLDPVYFSALYNAHGFLPPSSPSIAAAFIGTLQDALPKLPPAMFPSTSSNAMSLLPQNANENPN